MLTRFCLLTKTDFVCFLLMFPKYYTEVLYRCFLWYHLRCEHLTMKEAENLPHEYTQFSVNTGHQLKSKLA